MDKLIELSGEVIQNASEAAIKPLATVIGRVLLAEKFNQPEWLEEENE